MSAPRPVEEHLLRHPDALLRDFSSRSPKDPFEARIEALEAAASRFGGFSLEDYHKVFGTKRIVKLAELADVAQRLVETIEDTGIPAALALSALARETLDHSKKRNTGAYHTDFRLAMHLAEATKPALKHTSTIADVACGTGILLAASTIVACGNDRRKATQWLRHKVNAADMSPVSLRGALLSLASFTSDISALELMRGRWLCHDSLTARQEIWKKLAPNGFDIVIGNPPWEKVKTTRHEFLRESGAERHYGAEYHGLDLDSYEARKTETGSYAFKLAEQYSSLGGEIDLYMAFLELSLNLTRPGGAMSMLVPAGLIRSQGTEQLRRLVLSSSSDVKMTIFENRARFFAIDTRFKFLALTCTKQTEDGARKKPLVIAHACGTNYGVTKTAQASVGRRALDEIRLDLTVPEVRGDKEWSLFLAMSRNAASWDDPQEHWRPEIVREVDMTRDKRHFRREPANDQLPLIEGRMIHQHRFGAKEYVSGSGRRAIWKPLSLGDGRIAPQFWISATRISKRAKARSQTLRVGFCDITGQTNERSLLASLIPPGVVCGNKVPTVTFPDDPSEERLLLWTAIANSIPFDWLLRRVVTTTVNYFVLLGVPLPRISKSSLPGRQIIEAARALRDIDAGTSAPRSPWKVAELRARIDVAVAVAYGVDYEDLALMMRDFPLLDRGQPPLPGEERSTITRDFLLLTAAHRFRKSVPGVGRRVDHARSGCAVPYVTAEYGDDRDEAEADNG